MNVSGDELQIDDEIDTWFKPNGQCSRVVAIHKSNSTLSTPCRSITFTSNSKSGTTAMSVFDSDWFTLRNKRKLN